MNVRKAKVSGYQGLNEVNLFLVTTFLLDYTDIFLLDRQTHDALDFKLCRTDKNLTSLQRNVPSL